MSRPTNKIELQKLSQSEYKKLIDKVKLLPPEVLLKSGACELWSIKDILAHLDVWHGMVLDWYAIGLRGEKPEIPGKGYTWKTTPALNHKIYLENKDVSLEDVFSRLDKSYNKVQELISKHTDDELFTKKKYAWTGSTSLGAYFISCTSSHYDWASKLIKKFLK